MTSRSQRNRRTTVSSLLLKTSLAGLGALVLLLLGCEATAISDSAEPTWEPTASYDYIMGQMIAQKPAKPTRWASVHKAHYQSGAVTHFGSYYDDPFVIKGDGDDLYGWTWMDAAAFGYCPARFVANTICVPISMIKEPPGVLVSEDRDEPEYPFAGPKRNYVSPEEPAEKQ